MTEHVRTTLEGGVLTLVLDRPAKKNALTDAMYGALGDGLERAETDAAVGAVLITGEGGAFTAGNDLADFMAVAQGGTRQADRQVGRFLRALASATAPIVAAASGVAVGVGTTLLLHCDQVVLAEDAVLSTPFVDLGLTPEAASSLLMPARIGYGRAFRLLGLAERIPAREALAWGLADHVVPTAELRATAEALARTLAAKPRAALRATKALLRDAPAARARLEAENEVFGRQLQSPEARAAFEAFLGRSRG